VQTIENYRTAEAETKRRIQAQTLANYAPIARLAAAKYNKYDNRDEVEQVACLGLLVGLERWDPLGGEPFEVVAHRHARRELWRWSRTQVRRGLHRDHETRDAFVAAFAEVPDAFTPAEVEAVRAVYVEGLTMRDAGARLGVHVTSVFARVDRARRILRVWQRRRAASAA